MNSFISYFKQVPAFGISLRCLLLGSNKRKIELTHMMQIKKPILLLAVLLFSFFISKAQTGYYNEIKQYADSLYHSFENLQKKTALLAFSDTARIKWNNLPVGMRARAGLNIGNMNNDQRRHVHRILSASLSSQGYLKATGIMHLDNLINV